MTTAMARWSRGAAAVLVVVLAAGAGDRVVAFGTTAQRAVMLDAIESLPRPLKAFYKDHRLEMPTLAPEAETPPERGPERRFAIDKLLPFPFTDLPRSEAELQKKYGDQAKEIGRLPWLTQEAYKNLVAAYKEGDKTKILEASDALGVLVIDLHNPLLLTDNGDGQRTGQNGLYTRFAQRLADAMDRKLSLNPGAAIYLDDPNEYVFSIMTATYVWLDNVLYLEELAKRGKGGYSEAYYDDLVRRAGPILKERLARAAEDVGSYWYSAWTAAGRPEVK
jgi:hypothetical protein